MTAAYLELTELGSLSAWVNARRTQEVSAIQNLIELNNAIPVTAVYEQNHQVVNEAALTLLLNGQAPDRAALAELDAIAQQCPTSGGDAVYEARSLVLHYTGKMYNNEDCLSVDKRAVAPPKSSGSETAVLYPNPTTGWLNITGAGPDAANARVVNMLGQLAGVYPISNGGIDLSKVKEGVYTIQICTLGGDVLETKSVSILQQR
jgi:Secretion system C-terminal sorting domain